MVIKETRMERMVKMAAVPSVLLFIFLIGPASITVKTTSTNNGDLYQPQVGRSGSKQELLNSAADANGIDYAYDGRTKDSSTLIDSNPIDNNNLIFAYDPNVLGGYPYDVNNIGNVYNMYNPGNIPAANVHNPGNVQTAYGFDPYNIYGYSPQDTRALYVYNSGDTQKVFAPSQSNEQTLPNSDGTKNIYDAKYSYGSYPGEAKNTYSLYPSDSKNGYNVNPNNEQSNYISYPNYAKNSFSLFSSDSKNSYDSYPTDTKSSLSEPKSQYSNSQGDTKNSNVPKSAYGNNFGASVSGTNPSEAEASKENNGVSEASSQSKPSNTMGDHGNNFVGSSSGTKQIETEASNANKLSADETVSGSKPSDMMGGFGNQLSESAAGAKQSEATASNGNNLSGSEITSGTHPNAAIGGYENDFGASVSENNPSESKSSNQKNFSVNETQSVSNSDNAMSGYRNSVGKASSGTKQSEIKPSNENNLNTGESASGSNSYDLKDNFGNNFAESCSGSKESEVKSSNGNNLSFEETASRSNPSDAMTSYGNNFGESDSGKNPSEAKPNNENNLIVDEPSDIVGDFRNILSESAPENKQSEAKASNENNLSGSETTSGSNPNDIMADFENNFGESAPGNKQSETKIENEHNLGAGETDSGSISNDVMGDFENNFGEAALGTKTTNENYLSAVETASHPNDLMGGYGNNFGESFPGTKATIENNLRLGETASYDAMSNFGMKLGKFTSGTNPNEGKNWDGDNLSVDKTASSSNPSDTVNSFESILGEPISGSNPNAAKAGSDNNFHGSEITSGSNPSDGNDNQGNKYEENISETSPTDNELSFEWKENFSPEYDSFPEKIKKKYQFHSGKGKPNYAAKSSNPNIVIVTNGNNARSRYLSELNKAIQSYSQSPYFPVPYNSFVDIPADIYSGHNRHNPIADVPSGASDVSHSDGIYNEPSAEVVPAHRMNVGQFAAQDNNYNGIVHAVYPPKCNTLVLPSKLYGSKFNDLYHIMNHQSLFDSSKTFLPNARNTSRSHGSHRFKGPHEPQELKLKGQNLWKPRGHNKPRISVKPNSKFRLYPCGKPPLEIPGNLHMNNPICADTSDQGQRVEENDTEPVSSGPQSHRLHYFSRILNKPHVYGKYPVLPTSVHKLCPDSTFFVIENKKLYLSTTPTSDQSPNMEEKKEGEETVEEVTVEEEQEDSSMKKGETDVKNNTNVLDTETTTNDDTETTTNETKRIKVQSYRPNGHKKGNKRVTSLATTRKCRRKKVSSTTSSGNDTQEDVEKTDSATEEPMNTVIAKKIHKGNVVMPSSYGPDVLYRYTMEQYEKLLRNNLRGWPTYKPEHTVAPQGVMPKNVNGDKVAPSENVNDKASPDAEESGGNVSAEIPDNAAPSENTPSENTASENTTDTASDDASPAAKSVLSAHAGAKVPPAKISSLASSELEDDNMSPVRKALCWFLGVTIALLVLILTTGLMYMFFPSASCLTSCHSPYCSYSDECLQCRRGNRRTYSDGTKW